jgi:hypothetical protein
MMMLVSVINASCTLSSNRNCQLIYEVVVFFIWVSVCKSCSLIRDQLTHLCLQFQGSNQTPFKNHYVGKDYALKYSARVRNCLLEALREFTPSVKCIMIARTLLVRASCSRLCSLIMMTNLGSFLKWLTKKKMRYFGWR